MEIPLTFNCNNSCVSCIIDSSLSSARGDISWDEIRQRIDRLPRSLDTVGITGGEPTISPSFFKAMSYLRDARPDILVFLVTNARMFSYHEFAKRFSGIKIQRLRIGAAIYSHDPDMHDSITMTKGSWEQTIAGIRNLISLGIDVELRIIINKINHSSMEETARFIAKSLPKVERVVFINMKYTGNAFRNRSKIFISYRDITPNITKAVDILQDAGIPTRLFHFPLCTLPQRYRDIAKGVTKQMGELSFVKACDSCKARKDCPMIWKSYLVLADEDEFRPV
jgi:His-Xaa-Ser system radical SAM maturase HxsC